MTYALSVRDLSFQYPGASEPILKACDFHIPVGQRCVVLGPNGCGKSTLLKILAGVESPSSGQVQLRGKDSASFHRRAYAQEVALMPQVLAPLPGVSAKDLVSQGRYAQVGTLGMLRSGADERRKTLAALAQVGVEHFAERVVDSLSGGERQRVRLALALRQEAPILLLDEPLAHLDLRYQFELLETVNEVAAAQGLTVLTVLHELDLAVRWADRILVLNHGGIVADGHASEIITPELLSSVFGLDGHLDAEGQLRIKGRATCK